MLSVHTHANLVTTKTETVVPSSREEWTKYFVNGIECEQSAIYQTILDNKFYNGEVSLDKKYHFDLREEKVVKEEEKSQDELSSYRSTRTTELTNSSSRNIFATFGLNTKNFVVKCNPTSKEYILLVNKMIATLHTFYEAQTNYNEYSKALGSDVRDCIRYSIEQTFDINKPYHRIFYEFIVEQIAFQFDILALSLSNSKTNDASQELPKLEFDTSSIKEGWSENWTNRKKSRYINYYLSVILSQVDSVCQPLVAHESVSNTPLVDDIKSKFDNFKKLIISMQSKMATLKVSLMDVSNSRVASNPASHFGRQRPRTNTGLLPVIEQKVSQRCVIS
ncbi:MAG: hypothetical protein ABI597_00660 [Gammaproteobacteria bacterium]